MKSDTCMRQFEAWGLPQTHPFDVKFSPFDTHLGKWHGQTLETRSVDGRVTSASPPPSSRARGPRTQRTPTAAW